MSNAWMRGPALALALASGTELERADAQQCAADWGQLFPYESIPISVAASAAFDDGGGTALFVGGADDDGTKWFYRWDGQHWTAPSAPFQNLLFDPTPRITAMSNWNDGGTDVLVVAGEIRMISGVFVEGIARWDGTTWSPLGAGLEDGSLTSIVTDVEPFDDGTGGTLFASGLFTNSDGAPLDGIARWDGTHWIPLAGGAELASGDMQVYDDGGGDDLYVAGGNLVARWDGTAWSTVGATDGVVSILGVYDVGGGPELYAAGEFTTVGGVAASCVARWDGSSWSPAGAGITAASFNLADFEVFDDGTGPGLYLTGAFTVGGPPGVGLARWDGAWTVPPGNVSAATLLAHDDGSGPSLFAGGGFQQADGKTAPHVARFDGTGWSSVGATEGMNASVDALLAFDDGSGEQLYAGGAFTTAGAEPDAAALARWDGTAWSAAGDGVAGSPGTGVPQVLDLAVYDGGGGPSLYAGGFFTQPSRCVARWDGASWQPVGTGVNGTNGLAVVEALAVFDDGGGEQLYAAGNFNTAGGVPASWIARWDGSAWSALGPEVFFGSGSFSSRILDLAVHDDGSGPALWAAGSFSSINGSAGSGPFLARWDGLGWNAVAGTTGVVRRLVEFAPPGAGAPLLVAAGDFTQVGGTAASRIASWDGAAWSPLTSGLDGSVRGLRAWNDGVAGGERLLVTGFFQDAGGVPVQNLALWDGTAWSAAPGGVVQAAGRAFAAFDPDGTGASLYVGDPSGRLAEWRTDCSGPVTYCTGKTSSLGCVPFITTTGVPSATATEPFRVVANDVGDEVGRLWYSFKKANLNFHGGKLCIKAPHVRLTHKTPKQTGTPPCAWSLRRNFNARIQGGLDPQLTPGQTVFAQWRGRDPADPAGFGDMISDAVRFTIAP